MVKRTTPELAKLFRCVRALTKERGAIKRLADVMGVHQQSITDWLTERYEPGGEVTLRLQKWVMAAEAKQQKETAAMIQASPRRVTRKAKSKEHEKDKPSRSKR